MAAITGLWLLAGGFLHARHAAEVPHVRDGEGRELHGTLTIGEHGDDPEARVFERALAGHDLRACPLSASLHQPGWVRPAQLVSVEARLAEPLEPPPVPCSLRTLHVYRLAPKTSPPVA